MTGPPMGWLEATILGYAKAFSMRGQASRAEYWKFWAMSYALTYGIAIAMLVAGARWSTCVITLASFGTLTNIALWTAAVRRLRERGSSGWWTLPHPIMTVASAIACWEAAWLDPQVLEGITQPGPEMELLRGASVVYGLAELSWIPGFILLMLP